MGVNLIIIADQLTIDVELAKTISLRDAPPTQLMPSTPADHNQWADAEHGI